MTKARRIGLAAAIPLAGVALLAVAALTLVNTGATHRYVLKLITGKVQNATGARVEIGGLTFHRWLLGADFHQVTLRSPQSSENAPLFSADRVDVGIGLSLFRAPGISVKDVTLDHPVIHLFIDSRGNSNLPRGSGSASGAPANAFDLAIGRLVVSGGEIFYNDRRVPVTADLHDLNARAAYGVLTRSYDATLSYRDALVRYADLAPFTHGLDASLSAKASGVELKSLLLHTADSSIRAQGTLTNYQAPSFEGSYEASISTKELLKIATPDFSRSSQMLAGLVDTHGTIAVRSAPNVPVINRLSLHGTLSARTFQVDSPEIRTSVQNVTSDYTLEGGALEARKVDADAAGGHITGRLFISQLSGNAAARLDAAVQNVAIPALRNALHAQELPGIRMDGRISGKVQATWNAGMKDLQIVSNAQVTGTVGAAAGAGRNAGSFPVEGAAQAAYDGSRQIVTVHNGILNTPHSHLSIDGSLGNKANVKVEARSEDLHEVDPLLQLFPSSASASENDARADRQLLNLGGAGSLTGMIDGTPANPHFTGTLSATNVRVHNAAVQFVRAGIEASPEGIAVRQGELRNGPQARASFDISVGLRNWRYTPEQPIAMRVNAQGISVTDLVHMAGLPYPVTGVLTAAVTLSDTEAHPQIQGNIQVAQATAWQQPVQNLGVELRNSGSRLLANVTLKMPAGTAAGSIAYDFQSREYDLEANFQQIRLAEISYVQEHARQFSGVINVSARGRGSMASPQLDLSVDGQQLQIGEQKVDGFRAQVSVGREEANFEIQGNISGAALRSHGAVNLTGDYQASATIDSQLIQLDPLLQTFFPQAGSDLRGQTEIHGTWKGPLKNLEQAEAHLDIPSLHVGYPSIQLAATGPIHADYQRGRMTIARAELKGTGTDVTLEASIPLQAAADLRATAQGKVDFQLLQIWNPQWRTSGQMNLDVNVRGTRAHPAVSGTATVANAAVAMENVPTVEQVKGELDLSNEAVQVKSLTGKMGGGDVEIHGTATYMPGLRYNLGMTTRNVRLLYPDGVRTQLTAELNFVGTPENSNLTGQVTLDRLSLTQSFDLATFANQFGGPVTTQQGFAQDVKLNVAVNSRQELEVASSQLSIQGTADLQVRGTLAEPVLIGRTNLTGGEFFFNGRRFTVQNASIEFANPVRTNPVVHLTATTTVHQFNLTVNLVGPFDRLRTTYMSDPPLPPVDVINLLITGQTTEAAQGNTTTPQSVIAGQLAGKVSDRLQKLTGISSLTIDPQIGGNQGNGASQLAIQERVTKNLFFTFATDVTTTQGQVVQVEYQITKKYSMSAIRDQTGGYEVEIKSHKTF